MAPLCGGCLLVEKVAPASMLPTLCLIYFKGRVTERGKHTERSLSSAGSFPKWLQQSELGQSKLGARSFNLWCEIHPTLKFFASGHRLPSLQAVVLYIWIRE